MAAQPDPMSSPIGTPTALADGAARSNVAPRLPYDDLRQWLDEARRLGEVKDVSGLSWQQDIGMVAGVAMHDDTAACFVFDAVPGAIEGSRVLVNFFGGKRKNMTLGFPTELSKLELSEGFRTSFMGPMTRIPPKYVDDGPIFENVMKGDAVDITRFPAPKWHAPDGGRYIGTGSFNVTRDPDEGWINCGTYRVMIHDARTARLLHFTGQARPANARQVPGARRAHAGRGGLRRRSHDLPDGLQRGPLWRQRIRDRRRHARQAGRGDQRAGDRPADSGQCRDRARGLRRARQRARRRAVRRMDRLLRQRPAARAGAGHQGRSTTATIRSCWAACRSARRTRFAAIAPWCARRCCARTSRRPACRA